MQFKSHFAKMTVTFCNTRNEEKLVDRSTRKDGKRPSPRLDLRDNAGRGNVDICLSAELVSTSPLVIPRQPFSDKSCIQCQGSQSSVKHVSETILMCPTQPCSAPWLVSGNVFSSRALAVLCCAGSDAEGGLRC